MLDLKNYSVSTQQKQILESLNFTFEHGKIYALMGPNGSGKSTLAHSVLGSPKYTVSPHSTITFKGDDLSSLCTEERAKKGLFLSFQSPSMLSGVSVRQLLRVAAHSHYDAVTLRTKTNEIADALKIPHELLTRSLNDGFSGGEQKKLEVLQATLLDPHFLFFDEIDTGVDVDALKTISLFLKSFHTPLKTYVIITHYNRILKYLKPDHVLILKDGKIVKTGDASLAHEVENNGYDQF